MSNVPKDFIGMLPNDPVFSSGFEGWYGEIPTGTILDENGKVVQRYKNPKQLQVAQTNCTDAHSKFVGVLTDEELGDRVEALQEAQKVVETWPGNSAMNGPVRVALLTTSIYTVAQQAVADGRTPPIRLSVFWENLSLLDDDQLLATFRWEPLSTFVLDPHATLSRYQQELVDRGIAVYKFDDKGKLVSGLVPRLSQSRIATENSKLLSALRKEMNAVKNEDFRDAVSGRLAQHFE
jgi:hypothetical protein